MNAAAIDANIRAGRGIEQVVKITEKLVPRPLRADNVTPSALFRVIERHSPTLLVDEADAFAKENEELRGIINCGHERGGGVIRNVGDEHEPRRFKTWGPMLIAGIGSLAGTIEDRSIIIPLKRKRRDEQVERLRSTRCEHLDILARKIARWVRDNRGRLRDGDPTIPEELGDRGADNWRPLFAIADEAEGAWPERARQAARHLSNEGSVASQSARLKLLADIQVIFAGRKEDEISSSDLVAELVKLPDRPWIEWSRGRPISSKRVADFLTEFQIFPHCLKTGTRPNGYARGQFSDAFERYLDRPTPAFSLDSPLQSSEVPQVTKNQLVIDKTKFRKGEASRNFESATSDCFQNACGTSELRAPQIQEKRESRQDPGEGRGIAFDFSKPPKHILGTANGGDGRPSLVEKKRTDPVSAAIAVATAEHRGPLMTDGTDIILQRALSPATLAMLLEHKPAIVARLLETQNA